MMIKYKIENVAFKKNIAHKRHFLKLRGKMKQT